MRRTNRTSVSESGRQIVFYKNQEYAYRIDSGSLRQAEKEESKTAERILQGSYEGKYILLYHCICWKGSIITKEEFIHDCKTGMAMIRRRDDKNGMYGVYKRLQHAINRFKREGKLF